MFRFVAIPLLALLAAGCTTRYTVANPPLKGELTHASYSSPKGCFDLSLPISSYDVKIDEVAKPRNDGLVIEQVVFTDTAGMKATVTCSRDLNPERTDWFDIVYQRIASEVKIEGQQVRVEKKLVKDGKFGDEILLSKGPLRTDTGRKYIMSGIFKAKGVIYEIQVTNHTNRKGSEKRSAKYNYSRIFNCFHPEGGVE